MDFHIPLFSLSSVNPNHPQQIRNRIKHHLPVNPFRLFKKKTSIFQQALHISPSSFFLNLHLIPFTPPSSGRRRPRRARRPRARPPRRRRWSRRPNRRPTGRTSPSDLWWAPADLGFRMVGWARCEKKEPHGDFLNVKKMLLIMYFLAIWDIYIYHMVGYMGYRYGIYYIVFFELWRRLRDIEN